MNKWEFLEQEIKKQKEQNIALLSEMMENIHYCFLSIQSSIIKIESGDDFDLAEIGDFYMEGLELCASFEKEFNYINELENELNVLKYQKENALKFKDKDVKTEKKEY
mgnify:CR=1 FL=1